MDIRVQAALGTSYPVLSRGGSMARIGDGFDLIAASDWSSPKTIIVGSDEIPTNHLTARLSKQYEHTKRNRQPAGDYAASA